MMASQALWGQQWLSSTSTSARLLRQWLLRRTVLVDEQLIALRRQSHLPQSVGLIAIGGYGRSQLYPHSDVDVLLLMPQTVQTAQEEETQEAVSQFVSSCWDAGLEISHRVCTLVQCLALAREDTSSLTALLDARLIMGGSEIFAAMRQALAQLLGSNAQVLHFFQAKQRELRQRHQRFDNTPYALEPNCKESPGGLRDLHTILWVAQAAGLGQSWSALARSGILTNLEAQQLERNEAVLGHIRARLHLIAGRREERLLFDLQTAVAQSLGLKSYTPRGQSHPIRASEQLMRRYYWAAKAVMQLQHIVLLNIQERLHPCQAAPVPINEWFADKEGLLELRSPTLYQTQPEAILPTFLCLQTTPGLRGLSAGTLRALYHAREQMNAQWRRLPANRRCFIAILQQPWGVAQVLRLMNETSVLGRYLWSFRRIVGKMQHDLFHAYTVDQHTLMVVRNMRRFFRPEFAHEYPLCARLAGGWTQPWLLHLAALFHDIGKGRGGEHSAIGAIEVRRFARQHSMRTEDAELVEFLVREHLLMSHVAQKQDTNDPAVVSAFAQKVGSRERLVGLYLLTVADIRGTSPKLWTAWKDKLLQDLYHAALQQLQKRALQQPTQEQEVLHTRQAQVWAQLAPDTAPEVGQSYQRFWQSLGTAYWYRHEACDIAWHAQVLHAHLHNPKMLVRCRPSQAGQGLQVLVYGRDQRDLFARICAYFDRAGLSVIHARIHTTEQGWALDSFQIICDEAAHNAEHPHQHLCTWQKRISRELPEALDQSLEKTLEQALPPAVRRQSSRRARSFPIAPSVRLQPDDKGQRWLLEISASDRAGLLYSVACVLARFGLDVQLAKVMTLGERAEDSFLLHAPQLQDSSQQAALERALVQVLGG